MNTLNKKKFRIEICGGIASGKTSLVNLLEKNKVGKVIYEDFHSNPFWKAFYKNPGEYIFETELTFTLQHYHDIKKQVQNEDILICDYSLLLDLAYANIGLNGKKLDIYTDLINEIYTDIGKPDMYIYLECSATEELKRIKNRNRDVESNIQLDFLLQLNNELVIDIDKANAPNVLTINSEEYDFVHNEGDKDKILELIQDKIIALPLFKW